jgi:hypothetical protein
MQVSTPHRAKDHTSRCHLRALPLPARNVSMPRPRRCCWSCWPRFLIRVVLGGFATACRGGCGARPPPGCVGFGARSFAAIGQWVGDVDADLLAALGFGDGKRPSESAIRRAFGRLDAAKLDTALGSWMWTRTRVVDQRRVIAIDGKTIRGARSHDSTAPHLVAAYDHTSGTVLGQLAVAAKSNEIPAVRTLLAGFDLAGVVVTVDAMHTQTDTAQLIVEAGGDYVFTVKGNQPKLYAACKALRASA